VMPSGVSACRCHPILSTLRQPRPARCAGALGMSIPVASSTPGSSSSTTVKSGPYDRELIGPNQSAVLAPQRDFFASRMVPAHRAIRAITLPTTVRKVLAATRTLPASSRRVQRPDPEVRNGKSNVDVERDHSMSSDCLSRAAFARGGRTPQCQVMWGESFFTIHVALDRPVAFRAGNPAGRPMSTPQGRRSTSWRTRSSSAGPGTFRPHPLVGIINEAGIDPSRAPPKRMA
jgi:hypothetical protein